MTYRYPMQAHTAETLQLAVTKAFEAALPVADAQGVGLVVVVIDAAERVHYQTNLGPTMTAGALSRCAGLYDAKSAPAPMLSRWTPGLVSGGGISTNGPGGGGNAGSGGASTVGTGGSSGGGRAITLGHASAYVVSDPPQAGGEGRMTQAQFDERLASLPAPSDEAAVPSYPGELVDGFIECRGCAQPFPAAQAYQLRVKGKLFAFHPGQFCPDCAARYDRGELDPSSSPSA